MEYFGDVNTAHGLEKLNQHLENCSYLQGHTPSEVDIQVFAALSEAPQDSYNHVLRWYNHIKFLGLELKLSAGDDLTDTTDQLNINEEQLDNNHDETTEIMKMESDNEGCNKSSVSPF